MYVCRIGKAVAASLAKAPRPGLGSTVERDDFVNPATMTDTTVLPGDDTKILTAAVSRDKNGHKTTCTIACRRERQSEGAVEVKC